MTIKEALELCDRRRPNLYGDADKRQWLSDLDGRIYTEMSGAYEEEPFSDYSGYDENTPEDTKLLVPFPYDELYVHYLTAQVDYWNAEYARYANDMTMFASGYTAFTDWYNRTHMPRQKTTVHV